MKDDRTTELSALLRQNPFGNTPEGGDWRVGVMRGAAGSSQDDELPHYVIGYQKGSEFRQQWVMRPNGKAVHLQA